MRLLVAALVAFACMRASAADPAASLWTLYRQRDFFSLQAALPPATAGESARLTFLRAAVDAAFNRSDASADTLESLLGHGLADRTLELRARRLLSLDRRAQSRYADAILAAVTASSSPEASAEERALMKGLRNSVALMSAIADVAPQQVIRSGPPTPLALDKAGLLRARINGHDSLLGLDSGANVSFMPRSLALAAGLLLRPSTVEMTSSTGQTLRADAAEVDLMLGDITVRHAVFLVFPDEALTLPDGYVIPGMIGFPVFAALGGMQRDIAGNTIRFGPFDAKAMPNLALSGNDILTAVTFHGEAIICRVDSGADLTTFYEPFHRRFRQLMPSSTGAARLGGVGGAKTVPAVHPPRLTIEVAGRQAVVSSVDVLTRPIVPSEENFLACNIGLDVLAQFGSYAIDLSRMALTIGSP